MKTIIGILKVSFILAIASILYNVFIDDTNTKTKEEKNSDDLVVYKKEALEKKIKNQFHYYDGSHHNLVGFVKSNLTNYKSFKHIKTEAKPFGDNLLVYMQYEAQNKYGAIVINSISAEYDIDGNMIRVLQAKGTADINTE